MPEDKLLFGVLFSFMLCMKSGKKIRRVAPVGIDKGNVLCTCLQSLRRINMAALYCKTYFTGFILFEIHLYTTTN